jgi:hypothetical protein
MMRRYQLCYNYSVSFIEMEFSVVIRTRASTEKLSQSHRHVVDDSAEDGGD